MLSFLCNIRNIFSSLKDADSEIIGDVKFDENNIPYFSVKMQGCHTLVDVNAEDIVEKFSDKFNKYDLIVATKINMKYQKKLKLISIEKNFALFLNKQDHSYQVIDLSDISFAREIDHNSLTAEDAFILGVAHEKLRSERDRKSFCSIKSGQNKIEFTLVK